MKLKFLAARIVLLSLFLFLGLYSGLRADHDHKDNGGNFYIPEITDFFNTIPMGVGQVDTDLARTIKAALEGKKFYLKDRLIHPTTGQRINGYTSSEGIFLDNEVWSNLAEKKFPRSPENCDPDAVVQAVHALLNTECEVKDEHYGLSCFKYELNQLVEMDIIAVFKSNVEKLFRGLEVEFPEDIKKMREAFSTADVMLVHGPITGTLGEILHAETDATKKTMQLAYSFWLEKYKKSTFMGKLELHEVFRLIRGTGDYPDNIDNAYELSSRWLNQVESYDYVRSVDPQTAQRFVEKGWECITIDDNLQYVRLNGGQTISYAGSGPKERVSRPKLIRLRKGTRVLTRFEGAQEGMKVIVDLNASLVEFTNFSYRNTGYPNGTKCDF